VHWAAVRVHAASINARHVLFGPYLSARCDRISQGDLKLARILETERKGMCVCQYEETSRWDEPAGAFGSGSDNWLRVK
jgi:hypothetical protein